MEIGAYEAKTHLAQLLDRVANGEQFIITRHGHPVAALTPMSRRPAADVRAAIDTLKRFQAGHRLRGLRVQDMRTSGRKY